MVGGKVVGESSGRASRAGSPQRMIRRFRLFQDGVQILNPDTTARLNASACAGGTVEETTLQVGNELAVRISPVTS